MTDIPNDTPPGRFLFTYGTLMSTAAGAMGSAQRELLNHASTSLIRPATIAGRIFDLGQYPGLVETEGEGIVQGEVHELLDPQTCLAWLDAYEGIVPGCHSHNEYVRVERQVALDSSEQLTAWVYVYQLSVTAFAPIPDGRWIAR